MYASINKFLRGLFSMNYDYDLIVIGAGSAGLVVASTAANLGAKVALIEKHQMGGDCLYTGCIPSKTFLKTAHLAKDIQCAKDYGLDATLHKVDLGKVMDRVKKIIAEIAPHDSKERYESLGVVVWQGQASFLTSHSIEVNESILTGKKIVIATGSSPLIPAIKGLDTVPYLTNETIFDLQELPSHLIILGAGPIGLELGQGFCQLGANVSVIDQGPLLFNKDDGEVSPIMETALRQDGMQFHLSSSILQVSKGEEGILVTIRQGDTITEILGDTLLVALGRKPATQGLGLEKIGIITDTHGFVTTNRQLQTSVNSIYACGDVTGPYLFTHMASYQARIVVQNSLFGLWKKTDPAKIAWTTYTKPEVAHVGYTEAMAHSLGLFKESILINLADIDRAKAENDRQGFLKLILNPKGKIIGATLVGEKAGEMIPLASLAIEKNCKPTAFLTMLFAYPSQSEIFLFAAFASLKKNFKEWQKKLLKRIFFS
jgi:pyruvate/2-oxoglutarate dehydrogenase complex dihydrolipoamide dehydrogenase (E3) component